jgi:hypothetical protein
MHYFGDLAAFLDTGFTVPAPNSTDGVMGDFPTGSVAGNKNGVQGDPIYMRALDIEAYISFKLVQTTLCRMFIGFTDQTAATMVDNANNDNPPGNYFGIQYSTARGDSNFKIVRKNGTTQGTPVSDIAIDANHHDLYLRLFRASGDNECQSLIDGNTIRDVTDFIPGDTSALRFVAAIETRTSVAKSLRIGKVLIEQTY